MSPSLYDNIRTSVQETGSDSRVEVNQRALIDKILARYASAGAVYRELLQNSNDAEATMAEVHFTTVTPESKIVQQVLYRNNGVPFRPQDWSRLQKIAEGNPDVSKVGAFGVGAYTMFSICEEPLVISGTSSLCFVWKGDALWCKTAPLPRGTLPTQWTSFVLPSRDPYPLPDLIEFGEFLCSSLTFTQCLKHVRVIVNDVERLSITKTIVQEPRIVVTPKSSSWWSNQGGAVTTTPKGTFTLARNPKLATEQYIYESIHRITVQMADGSVSSSMDARYVSATVNTKIGPDMARRMERVTKKQPPQQVQIQLFLNATRHIHRPRNGAEQITQSFSPKAGAGRIFIGFRTSQTTGLAAHVAAPFVPTVEREAMDLQDPTLRIFNLELLEMAGILLRLTLEHSMYTYIDAAWKENAVAREKLEEKLRLEAEKQQASSLLSKNKSMKSEESDDEVSEAETTSTAGTLMSFARFMARGVKKKVVSVVTSVGELMDDGSDLLKPADLRPLSSEEEDAVVLMQSFCPMQSTPDPLVGTALAQGFSRCLPDKSPPVLTRSGVVRGDEARLPNHGIEAFVKNNVVRSIVFDNCEEYHSVIAACRKINLNDLLQHLRNEPIEEADVVRLIKWLVKFKRFDPNGVASFGPALKDVIRFYPATASTAKNSDGKEDRVPIALSTLLFYVEKESVLASPTLPMPETILPQRLQDQIGSSNLTDPILRQWFSPLPVEIWAEFISHHPSMTEAKPEDEHLRVEIVTVLSSSFSRRALHDRDRFGYFCRSILADKRCLPFDSDQPTAYAAERPPDLYLYSAELKAFEGVGSFFKAAAVLKANGVTEDFLLALGVRKSVSIDFLFANLQSLKWSSDPKPLVEYLRTATLTSEDMRKLAGTQYLPAVSEPDRLFAPFELYLPNKHLQLFPFLRVLRWPSEPELSERTDNGRFLMKIGMKYMPPLVQVLQYISMNEMDLATRVQCLDFICERLGPQGLYQFEYSKLSYNNRKTFRFVPCITKHPFDLQPASSELQSPVTCFSEESCAVMGFPVMDTKLGPNRKLYGNLFNCPSEPEASLLVQKLNQLVASAKALQLKGKMDKSVDPTQLIMDTFVAIFKYLSHRTSELTESSLRGLRQESFIPCIVDGSVEWFRPDQVFFRSANSDREDTITEELFRVIDFSPFLAAAGVKQEASTKDIFQLMLTEPAHVLKILGSEKKYRTLLRRIAADPPFPRVTPEMRQAPFLLAYKVKATDKTEQNPSNAATYHLAKAEDIYIIDNSFFGRMFLVDRAPPESDLEDFYARLGSKYISQTVDRRFEVVGKPDNDTETTRALKKRLLERGPLLVSPNITTRPLVKNAASVLSEKNLTFFEASNLMAVYSLDGKTQRNQTTCCSRQLNGGNAVFVVKKFDWFDVGYAIGDLILTRCQLEDAFFISSLLEAPLEQLRARGFPVDRIIQAEPPKPVPVKQPMSAVPVSAASKSLPNASPVTNASTAASEASKLPSRESVAPSVTSKAPSDATAPPAATAKAPEAKQSTPSSGDTATTRPDSHLKKPEETSRVPEEHLKMPKAMSEAPVAPPQGKKPSDGGMEDIIMQMFPDADRDFVRSALGSNPSFEDVSSLANQMSSGSYPKDSSDDATVASSATSGSFDAADKAASPGGRNGRLRKRLGRILGGGLRGNKLPSSSGLLDTVGSTPPPNQHSCNNHGAGHATAGPSTSGGHTHHTTQPVNPAIDAQSQSGLERMLEQSVRGSAAVEKQGFDSLDSTITSSLPEGLDRGDSCEVIPGTSLQPFLGSRGDGKTVNGIRIFSYKPLEKSELFLRDNEDMIEKFGLVLERLADVYGLKLNSIAIYHDPVGQSIAFNRGKALHFNVRFFYALHYLTGKADHPQCYSYWYVTMAHELAHHLVSAHTKEHGFYTESFTAQYMPRLMNLLASM